MPRVRREAVFLGVVLTNVVLVVVLLLTSSCGPSEAAIKASQAGAGWVSDGDELYHKDVGTVRCFKYFTELECVKILN